jgi:hypothetical protein
MPVAPSTQFVMEFSNCDMASQHINNFLQKKAKKKKKDRKKLVRVNPLTVTPRIYRHNVKYPVLVCLVYPTL